MIDNPYERDSILAEYLLFHYGDAAMTLSHALPGAPSEQALHYAARCVTENFQPNASGRALDLGCAVGRSSFEFAGLFAEVIGIDYSAKFIEAATLLKNEGELEFDRKESGNRFTRLRASVSPQLDRARVTFRRGDAMELPDDLGIFDAVLLANLIDRLTDPTRCLDRLPSLVRSGGQLVITSPYTWLEEYTPRTNWLMGDDGETLSALVQLLEPHFTLIAVREMPFLIREHARKYQWSVAQATLWQRK